MPRVRIELTPAASRTTPSGWCNLFFHLVNACYERCDITTTGNRGFGEWADIFGDAVVATALLDRLSATSLVTLDQAFLAHPNRFKGKLPQPHHLPTEVWIDPAKDSNNLNITQPHTLN